MTSYGQKATNYQVALLKFVKRVTFFLTHRYKP